MSKNGWPRLPGKNATVEIPAQDSPRYGTRKVKVYVFYPGGTLANVNARTGIFLSLHNWGGTCAMGTADPVTVADRYNVTAICVDYLQSGLSNPKKDRIPYDLGYWQALDALRALYFVRSGLMRKGVKFDRRRTYVGGGSGGGNVSLMANKLAPRTFACVVNFSGVAGLVDRIAFQKPGVQPNARWSRDPENPNYLPLDAQQIRDPGLPAHLAKMKALGNRARLVFVHGVDDAACLISETRRLVRNMQAAGLDVETHYIRKKDVDGDLFLDSLHRVGNRTRLLIHFADKYLLPGSAKMRLNKGTCDFDAPDEAVRYATRGGEYVISYAEGYPVGKFEPRV